ncbi:MAG: ketopantoate reductase family protein, partial [Chloroflexi bacterium]|nr:ketopantoate reductase family protein [Chloroflexota bacterium]
GAVGGVIGARLFEVGHDVVLIARGPHLDAIRDRGLTLETPLGSNTFRIPAVGHPSELRFTHDDVVLLTMKTQHTEAALDDLRAVAGDGVPVVCAQNGVENERIAARRLTQVYGMMVWLPATYLEPGIVQASAAPVNGVLDTGRYPEGTDSLIEQVAAGIDASGIASVAVPDVMRWKYAKLLSNLGNAIQAACDPADDARPLYARVREEALACYRAAGIQHASDEEQAARRTAMSPMAPIAGSRRGGGSTWQSLARGAGSVETDYLNGEIALLGRLHAVPTPANAALQRIAARMAHDGTPPGSMRLTDVEQEIA